MARARESAERLLTRLLLVVLGVVLLWGSNRALFRSQVRFASAQAPPSWSGWVLWLGLAVLAGVAVGLAAMLPDHFGYRFGRAFVLGIVPLLLLAHLTFAVGPLIRFTAENAHWLVVTKGFFFDGLGIGYALAVALGVAIAAGFDVRRSR